MRHLISKKINCYSKFICKGAKRKSERTAVEETEEFINIVKARKDPITLGNEFYPPWMHDFMNHRTMIFYSQFDYFALGGGGIPGNGDIVRFFKLYKQQIRRNRIMLTKWHRLNGFHLASREPKRRDAGDTRLVMAGIVEGEGGSTEGNEGEEDTFGKPFEYVDFEDTRRAD